MEEGWWAEEGRWAEEEMPWDRETNNRTIRHQNESDVNFLEII